MSGRDTIGHNALRGAKDKLTAACGAEAAMFTRQIALSEVMEALFDDATLEIAKKAKALIEGSDTFHAYQLPLEDDPVIGIDYSDSSPYSCITSKVLKIDRLKLDALAPVFYEMRDLMIKWGKVWWMLNWLNENATPAQIRFYWPSAMALCPTAPKLKDFVNAPTRVAPLPQVAEILPIIRETANTVATMKLIPHDARPRKRENLWLTWSDALVIQGGVKVRIEGRTFFL